MLSALIMFLLAAPLLLWLALEFADIWRNRPVVIWDDYELRWRPAKRLNRPK